MELSGKNIISPVCQYLRLGSLNFIDTFLLMLLGHSFLFSASHYVFVVRETQYIKIKKGIAHRFRALGKIGRDSVLRCYDLEMR
jgi:hypothetical protein